MTEDSDIRKADRAEQHLAALYKTYNREKVKKGRDLLLQKTLDGESKCVDEVKRFCEDHRVFDMFKKNATSILQGHLNKSKFNTCLGLLSARLIFQ